MTYYQPLLVCIVISFFSTLVSAEPDTLDTRLGPINISWVSDRNTGYNVKGEPLNVVNINDQLPATFLADIYAKIPDGRRVNPDYIDTDSKSNLVIDNDFEGQATVSVTFLNEGAYFRNTFGYFLYDPNSPPQTFTDIAEHKIVFPNASKPNAGLLDQGDTVPLDIKLTAGQAMGFFVIPNGWGFTSSYAELESSGYWAQAFYSLPHLNPEPEGVKQHNVVFYDTQSELLVIAFEDYYRMQGDNDFNDMIFSLDVTPVGALEGINDDGTVTDTNYNLLIEEDLTPTTSSSYYPSASGYATIMFEDRWPKMGDYDFNDLVIKYRYYLEKDANNNLLSLELKYKIQAIGADYHNGFALHFPNVTKSNIKSATLQKSGSTVTLQPEEAASEVIFILSADVWQDVSTNCNMFRTLPSCKNVISSEFVLNVEFNQSVAESSVGLPPYDLFIFASEGKPHGEFAGRQWEVHLKEFSGTSLFNQVQFGLHDDNSNATNSFVNSNNFPWAINVLDDFEQPLEGKDIQKGYPDFAQWVINSGASHTDWYKPARSVVNYIYK